MGETTTLCSWCSAVSLVTVFDETPSRSQVTHVPEPLCKACFDEIASTLEGRIREAKNASCSSNSPARYEIQTRDTQKPQDSRDQRVQPERRRQQGGREQREERREDISRGLDQLRTLKKLQAVESDYWKAYNALHVHLLAVADKRDSLQRKLQRTEKSVSSNVGLDYFKIAPGTQSSVGTINGFRLGTLPHEPVDWVEINCAWGVAVLLLERLRVEVLAPLAPKHRKHFWIDGDLIRWEARGSWPRVVNITDSKTYELHGPVSKILCPGYDRALVLFARCLLEVGRALGGSMPHETVGDQVGGVSVRRGLARDVTWTLALRNVLENLKWCVDRWRIVPRIS